MSPSVGRTSTAAPRARALPGTPRVTFHGAAGQVTGSCYLIETARHRILLECGLFQGDRRTERLNERRFPFKPERVDAVVLSHAHLDHSGLLPKLADAGFRGRVYMTPSTHDLVEIMLKDAAHLQMRDVEWHNKWRQRAGKPLLAPLYDLDAVERTLALRAPRPYAQRFQVVDGVQACFRDAGHILGSAIVELWIDDGGREHRLVFSGDLGNSRAALLRDPEPVREADLLLLESTYGDRAHRPQEETLRELLGVLDAAAAGGGNVLIPAFAVGRTQEILYHLGRLYRDGRLRQQVFLDSPMAIAATEVYQRHLDVFNRDDAAAIRAAGGRLKDWLPNLRYSHSTEDSMALNKITGGALIIAGSGMCSGGRIVHHLKYNLWRPQTHVVIVGFQARGTPGRALVDGARQLRLLGAPVAVKAAVHTLGGFSAHAGQDQLLDWAARFAQPRPSLCLVHGEPEKSAALRDVLRERLDWPAAVAEPGATLAI